MAKTSPLINALNAGELSPLIDVRVDVNKYYKGCRTLQNALPLVEGGVKRVPGTYFVVETKDSSKRSRLAKFHFNTEQAYILEFGDQYIRFYKNNGQILIDTSIGNFDPAFEYFIGMYAKIGAMRTLDCGSSKKLYVISPYGMAGETLLRISCVSNSSDVLAVTANDAESATANPTSDESVSGDWDGSAGSRYTLVDDYPDNSGDHLHHGTTAGRLTFGFTAFSIPAGATINSVHVHYYDQEDSMGSQDVSASLKVGGTYYDHATTHDPSGATLRTLEWTQNPKTSTAWTVDDVNGVGANALQAFGFYSTDASPTVRFYSVMLEINYTPIKTINIKLADTTGSYNTALLIQDAIRALGTVSGLDVSEFTVTENAEYYASRPTSGVSIAAAVMSDIDKFYQLTTELPWNIPTYTNYNKVPSIDTTYWTEVTLSDPVEIATPYLEADLFDLDLRTQGGDMLYIFHPSYAPRKLIRYAHVTWGLKELVCVDRRSKIITNISNANPGKITCDDHGLATGNYIYVRDVEGMIEVNDTRFYITKVDSDSFTIGVNTSSYASYISGGEFTPGITDITQADPAVVTMARHGFSNGDKIRIFGVDGMTELNDRVFTIAGRTNTTFQLDGEDSSAYTAYTGGGSAELVLFAEADDYPACGTFFEQRLGVAGSNNNPTRLNVSSVADYEDFSENVNADDYAMEFTLISDRIDKIRWLIGQEFLMAGTSGGVWRVGATNPSEPMSATNILARKQTTLGASSVIPQMIADSILWVTRSGRGVRRLVYTMEQDKWIAPDMTRVASHIAVGATAATCGIKELDFQAEPTPILWAIRNDGQIICMTYEIQEDVYSWFRIVTDGEFESVAVITEDDQEDQVWVIVNRTINGNTKRYVEFFKPQNFFSEIKDCFFVHSGLSWHGGDTADATISGITKANPAVVTATGHTFTNGMKVRITGVVGMTEVNCADYDDYYTVAGVVAGVSFQLSGVNSSAYAAYVSGGTVERITNTISGLTHLEGKDVSILGDGVDFGDETVASGAITLDHYAHIVHVGLPYTTQIEPMKLHHGSAVGTARGKKQRINRVTVCLYETCGGYIGKDENNLLPIDATAEEGVLVTDDIQFEFEGDWDDEATICVVQERPYPLSIRALVPRVSLFED